MPDSQYDAFLTAFRIPNLLRDLFAEGALSAAFVTTFTQVQQSKGAEEAFRLSNRVATALMILLVAAISIVGWIFTPSIVYLLAPGFFDVPGKAELTIQLTRIMIPFLLLIALAAQAMGILNARQHLRDSGPRLGVFQSRLDHRRFISRFHVGPIFSVSAPSRAWLTAPSSAAFCSSPCSGRVYGAPVSDTGPC